MYQLPTAPRPIGGVLDDAIQLYRASFARCWGLALLGGLLSGAADLYQTWQLGTLNLATLTTSVGATVFIERVRTVERSPGLWACYLLMLLAWLAVRAALVARQDAVANARSDSFGSAVAFAVGRLPTLIVAGIVWSLVVGIGTALLIIPGIWLWGQLQLWWVAPCAEDLGPFGALGRSWRLIEHHWWRTATTVTVAFIIILVLSSLSFIAGGAFIGIARGNLLLIALTTQIVAALISIFTTPLMSAVMLSIYYDLRRRREGAEVAASRLSSPQPA